FAGKILVISDLMTLCQESCPLDTANMVSAARTIEQSALGSKVEFLSITVDPARDTPSRLAAYKRLFSSAPANWTLLTASPPTLTALWKRLGVYIKIVPDTPPAPKDWLTGLPLTYDITHTDAVFFLDSQSKERFLLAGTPHLAVGTTLPKTLEGFLSPQGLQDVAHPEDGFWSATEVLQVLSWLTKHPIAQPSAAK
ncbi:MAG: SCO family protein, partial [Jatrophihabitantaceae bacterium]